MEKIFAYTEKGLPFGTGGVREVTNYTPGHSIYVKIDLKESPYKDQDYWQVWEGKYFFCDENGEKLNYTQQQLSKIIS